MIKLSAEYIARRALTKIAISLRKPGQAVATTDTDTPAEEQPVELPAGAENADYGVTDEEAAKRNAKKAIAAKKKSEGGTAPAAETPAPAAGTPAPAAGTPAPAAGTPAPAAGTPPPAAGGTAAGATVNELRARYGLPPIEEQSNVDTDTEFQPTSIAPAKNPYLVPNKSVPTDLSYLASPEEEAAAAARKKIQSDSRVFDNEYLDNVQAGVQPLSGGTEENLYGETVDPEAQALAAQQQAADSALSRAWTAQNTYVKGNPQSALAKNVAKENNVATSVQGDLKREYDKPASSVSDQDNWETNVFRVGDENRARILADEKARIDDPTVSTGTPTRPHYIPAEYRPLEQPTSPERAQGLYSSTAGQAYTSKPSTEQSRLAVYPPAPIVPPTE